MPDSKQKPLKQVGALPIRANAEGQLRVMLMTSRETKRLIVPKGWPMKGRKDHRAAAIEALQEAGLVGRVHKKPIGSYTYWKRSPSQLELCRVKVFLLEVERQLPVWKEREERKIGWFGVETAADLVDDPGLGVLIRKLPKQLRRRARDGTQSRTG